MKQETYQDFEKNLPVDITNAYMQDYVFHYNIFTHAWAAIPRELYLSYWSDYNQPGIIRSSNIETLLSLLHKAKGDIDEINKIVS